jgi:hypothetical protein
LRWRESPVWVWTDELLASVDDVDGTVIGGGFPPVAYAIDGERDLATLASELFRLAVAPPTGGTHPRNESARS